jgi:hypothetical protein
MTTEILNKAFDLKHDIRCLEREILHTSDDQMGVSKKIIGDEIFEQVRAIVTNRLNTLIAEKQKEFDAL